MIILVFEWRPFCILPKMVDPAIFQIGSINHMKVYCLVGLYTNFDNFSQMCKFITLWSPTIGDLAAKDVDRIQQLQNRAARFVTRSKAEMHITPIHQDLDWLPIQERINYKIIVTVYKCIHRPAPTYLSSILTTRTRDNRLRQKQV